MLVLSEPLTANCLWRSQGPGLGHLCLGFMVGASKT